MHVSFTSAVESAGSYLPETVLRPQFKRALKQLGPVLRDCCSSYYFEWHLEEPDRVDLLASLTLDNRSRFLAMLGDENRRGASKKALSLFAPCMPLLMQLETMHRTLDNGLPHIWFAWDFSPETEQLSPPNIHFCIDRNFTNRTRERSYINNLSRTAFGKTVDTLLDAQWHASVTWPKRHLKDGYALLRSLGGEVIHLSFMHSRHPATAKLNMTVPTDALEKLLSELGWSGDRSAIMEYCALFAPGEPRIKGNICFTENVFSRFELELEYNFPLATDPRRRAMLQGLAHKRLAARTRIPILRQWPGRTDITCRRRHGTFERWLDCKLCFTPDGTVFAKPYFGFATLPRIGWNRDVLYE